MRASLLLCFFLLLVISHAQSENPDPSKRWIDSETTYAYANGELLVQNSFPRGGSYVSTSSDRYGYGIFWTRVTNHTDSVLRMDIKFPDTPQPIPNSSGSYFRLLLPEDSLTPARINSMDYGVDDLTALFEQPNGEFTTQQCIAQPGDTCAFYTAVLLGVPDNGPVRTGITIDAKQVIYRISIDRRLDTTYIPCGHIDFND